MIYTIEGRYKNKAAVDQYIDNLCKELKLFKRLEIDIMFKTKLEGDCQGLCTEGDPIEIEIARTQYDEPLSFFEQMCTLAHEMVHVKQFMRGEYPSEREAKDREYYLFGKCFPWHMIK